MQIHTQKLKLLVTKNPATTGFFAYLDLFVLKKIFISLIIIN